MPHRDVELHLHPRDPRGKIRSLRLRPRATRLAAAGLALLLGLIAAGIAAAPRSIRTRLSEREYATSVALRQELGDRLQALVGRLGELTERGRRLRERLERIERVYGLAGNPEAAYRVTTGPAPRQTIYARLIEQGNLSETELARDLTRIATSVARIAALEAASPEIARTIPVRSPLQGENVVLSSGFGPRRSPYTREMEDHSGIDLAAPRGTPVTAPSAGVVVWAGVVPAESRGDWWRLGRSVVLKHGDSFRTIYGHLDEIRVRVGQRVAARSVIGSVGETGWTTAPNLHYEVRKKSGPAAADWQALDPRDFLLDLSMGRDSASTLAHRRPGATPESAPLPRQFLR